MTYLNDFKSTLKNIQNWFTSTSNKNEIIWICGLVFTFSYWLISRNNGYFSGDMSIVGTITKDFAQGNFYSWYFYGQDYFGNLEPIFLAILTKVTGNTIQTLYFWEHFWYFLTSLFVFLTIPKLKNWQTILSVLAFFFSVRYYNYTYYPQGFAFTLLLLIMFWALFEKVYSSTKVKNWHFLAVGFFTTLGIWFNPTISIIFPIFLLIYAYLWKTKKLEFKLMPFVYGIVGLTFGIIPFVLAYFHTDGWNLLWFSTNKSSNIIENIRYFGTDFAYYFVNEASLNLANTSTILSSTFLNVRNLFGLILSFLIFVITVISFKFWKQNLVTLLFLSFSLLLLVNKDLGDSNYLFEYIRYSIPALTFILILIFKIPTLSLDFPTINKFNFNAVYKNVALILIITLSLFGISRAWNLFKYPNRDPQLYETVANKLVYKYNTKNLFCDNFYDMCMAISYVNKDKNFNVEIINNNEEMAPRRNPGTIGKVQKAYENGEVVYSLIRANILKPTCKVEETFSFTESSTKYFLVKGKYSDC